MPNVSLWLIMPLILSTNLLALLHTKSLYKDVIIYNDIYPNDNETNENNRKHLYHVMYVFTDEGTEPNTHS